MKSGAGAVILVTTRAKVRKWNDEEAREYSMEVHMVSEWRHSGITEWDAKTCEHAVVVGSDNCIPSTKITP